MRLFSFLNEKEYLQKIEYENILKILESDYKQNGEYTKKKGPKLYRGDSELASNIYYYAGNIKRKTDNKVTYNNLLSLLSSWNDFPDRTMSIMASTRISGTTVYGKPFIVIPKDNTEIIGCSEIDFWAAPRNIKAFKGISITSFTFGFHPRFMPLHIIKNVSALEKFIEGPLIKLIKNEKYDDITKHTYLFLAAYIKNKNNAQNVMSYWRPKEMEEFCNKYTLNNMILKDILDYFLNPNILKVKKLSYFDIKPSMFSEVGFNQPCILLKQSVFDELRGT